MNNCIKTVLAISSLVFTLQFSMESNAGGSPSSFSCGSAKKLTAAQCTALRNDLQTYITFVNKNFGNGPIVQLVIKLAQADVNKLCPVPAAPANGWTADTQFECTVPSAGNNAIVSLGLDSAGAISTALSPTKILCVSEAACSNIVSQKFFVFGSSQSARCSSQTDTTVQHLTDAQLQSKISLLP